MEAAAATMQCKGVSFSGCLACGAHCFAWIQALAENPRAERCLLRLNRRRCGMEAIQQETRQVGAQSWRQEATALLRADHKRVSELFLEYRRTRGREDKRALIDRICQELGVHAQLEEEIFYPAVKDAIDEPGIVAEARIEHATLKALMARLQGGQPGEENFEATVKVLAEYVMHHV